ncbi:MULTISPECIES: DUF4974 domain-containing protein [Bacteroides]|uniref:DUF4974 domain-containing protein n=1 Tax=Bacteroides TaxID=816 RepID=UPI000E44704C|nr:MULTISPECIES: DUF4974 domain-containing protein [Bacteroides]RGM48134.1 DUF4974 domain-containing protein [Bacteroides sp. OM08-11]
MKISNKDFDKVLNKLVTSTRSPRGHFSAESSWNLLETKILARKKRRIFWLRMTSSAAVVLLCLASWAAYHALNPEPAKPEPIKQQANPAKPEHRKGIIYFQQQPLQEIVRQLSEIFHKEIIINDDDLCNYRMTGTFDTDEELTEILDLLKGAAGNFDYTETNNTIIITKPN